MSIFFEAYEAVASVFFSSPEAPKPVKDVEPAMQKIQKLTIDPMSTMVQLGLLYHKKVGTKLSIGDHRIQLQEVESASKAQPQVVEAPDLKPLIPVIQTAVKWYQPRTNEKTQKIFLRTIKGLEALRETYKGSAKTVEAINEMIQTISSGIKNTIPHVEPKNLYQKRVKELWKAPQLDEVNKLLDTLPGKFHATVVEADRKIVESSKKSEKAAGKESPTKNVVHAMLSTSEAVAKTDAVQYEMVSKDDVPKVAENAKNPPKQSPVAQQPIVPRPLVLEANIEALQKYNNEQIAKYKAILRDEAVDFFTYV